MSLFNDFASEMVYPLLPAFVTGTLGGGRGARAPRRRRGPHLGGAQGGERPPRRPARLAQPLILVGYATAVLVRPLISVASSAWQVVGFRVIDRVGKGLRTRRGTR